ncbi:MAG: Cu(I)-responsive transcriptional regulator [Alphaproteobacteria bacterium]|jgi:MerR family copper efflux transcriptional regulator|nr:Cu(I)-responsive transcriptional regulator [Alphaproteobacteria bacterium]HJP22737.1 Cu(I)-responsive transcriptional regulator [Alphaproteobacteria bacterium]|tara:strand:- start:222 stop:623 length:402 start_codon:yes stop_codon:yes gene_type:complete
MNIGRAAERSGVTPKTIRYYEQIGLVAPAERRANGYRAYSGHEVETLRFINRARSLGFAVPEIAELLELYRDRGRASADVKAIALARIDDIERKIAELGSLRDTLRQLSDRCHGDQRPECPILDDLADGSHSE